MAIPPYFIGDGVTHTFYQCNYAFTSSLFEPNRELVNKFQNLDNLMRAVALGAYDRVMGSRLHPIYLDALVRPAGKAANSL
jgi:hypothetical protein